LATQGKRGLIGKKKASKKSHSKGDIDRGLQQGKEVANSAPKNT